MTKIEDCPISDRDKLLPYLGNNALCSVRHKLLYIATPKVACTSLKWWFADLTGYAKDVCKRVDSSESDPDLIIHDSFYKVAPDVTGLSLVALREPLTSDAFFRFALVRNPYKRIFSAWQSKLLLREPLQSPPYLNCSFYNWPIKDANDIAKAFEEFLEHLALNEAPNFLDVHWTPQVDLLRPDLINYTKLVKIENTKELSSALSDWLGSEFVDPFNNRNTNESLIPYLPELISSRSAELIRLLYAKDFAVFDYDEKIPPAKETFSIEQYRLVIKAIETIRGRHKRIGDMLAQLAKQARVIVEQGKAIDEQAKIIDEQAKIIDEQAKIIDEIYASRLWKLTRPLRFLKDLVNRFHDE